MNYLRFKWEIDTINVHRNQSTDVPLSFDINPKQLRHIKDLSTTNGSFGTFEKQAIGFGIDLLGNGEQHILLLDIQ